MCLSAVMQSHTMCAIFVCLMLLISGSVPWHVNTYHAHQSAFPLSML